MFVFLFDLFHAFAVDLTGAGGIIGQQVDDLINDIQLDVVMHNALAGCIVGIDLGPESDVGDDDIGHGEWVWGCMGITHR